MQILARLDGGGRDPDRTAVLDDELALLDRARREFLSHGNVAIYRERDAVFYDLGTALAGMGRKAEARLYFERVISEFPKSEYADKAKRRLDQMKTA